MFHYPEQSFIPKHKDPGRQLRLNVVIWKPKEGGKFWCKGRHVNWRDRLIIFRADRDYHGISVITKGTRVLISVGLYF